MSVKFVLKLVYVIIFSLIQSCSVQTLRVDKLSNLPQSDQQQNIETKYFQAIQIWKNKKKPIDDYIINVCRPQDDQGYINCVNSKKEEAIKISLFPSMEVDMFNEKKEYDHMLLRKDIDRIKFKELVENIGKKYDDLLTHKIEQDVQDGVYRGAY